MAHLPFLSFFFLYYSFVSLIVKILHELSVLCSIIVCKRFSLPIGEKMGGFFNSRTSSFVNSGSQSQNPPRRIVIVISEEDYVRVRQALTRALEFMVVSILRLFIMLLKNES